MIRARRLLPYDASRFVHVPGGRPYCIHLKVALGSAGLAEALESILSDVIGLNVPVLQVSTSRLESGRVHLILFVDFKGREDVAGMTLRTLKSNEFVEDVEMNEPLTNGVAMDGVSFPLLVGGERAIIMRNNLYASIIRGMWEKLGTGYGILLYHMGFEAGRNIYRSHREIARDREALIRWLQEMFRLMGYGLLEVVELDEGRKEAVMRVYNSFECELFRGAGEIRSNLVRGILAGWVAEHLGRRSLDYVRAIELKCIAKGDPYCEYLIRVR